MSKFILVGFGGFLGSIFRYSLSLFFVPLQGFPLATFIANVSGCFLIGLCWGLFREIDTARLLLIAGFLGDFTTFSSFSLETITLLKNQQTTTAALYVAGSVLAGLLMTALGFLIASKVSA